MANALVTGAAGFVGRNVVSGLLDRGHSVTALIHNASGKQIFDDMDVEVVVANVQEPDSYRQHVMAADQVYHLAAVVAPYREAYAYDVNVGGTRKLASLIAQAQTPATLVYVSSLAAAGPCQPDQPRREDAMGEPVSIYGRSKRAAEEALTELSDRLPISVVRPPCVFGPWDRSLLELVKTVQWRFNPIGISKKYRYSFIHVEDLVNGMMDVAERGRRLRCGPDDQRIGTYFLSDPEVVSFEQIGNMIAKALQRPEPFHVTMPLWLCAPAGLLTQWNGRLFNKRTFLNVDKVREARAGSWICDTSRARDEVGFQTLASLCQRIEETCKWYQEKRWL